MRYYNDVVFTYKATDALTSVTEMNYSRDEFGAGNGPASFYSIAQYFWLCLQSGVHVQRARRSASR